MRGAATTREVAMAMGRADIREAAAVATGHIMRTDIQTTTKKEIANRGGRHQDQGLAVRAMANTGKRTIMLPKMSAQPFSGEQWALSPVVS